jgi:hypothetical protein
MSAPAGTSRILVVANRTDSTPTLLKEVADSARSGARFTLLIPPEKSHNGGDWLPDDAQRLVGGAAGGSVEMLDPGADAVDTIHAAVDRGDFDEIIVCTPPEHLSRWLHHDLVHRIEHLGLPVRVIPHENDAPMPSDVRQKIPDGWTRVETPGAGGAGTGGW